MGQQLEQAPPVPAMLNCLWRHLVVPRWIAHTLQPGFRHARRIKVKAVLGGIQHATPVERPKGYGLKCPGWQECSLAAISQTTTHMHGHHEATMGLAGVSLGRELRALALRHTASVRRGTA
eukprot:scaffold50024_cov62-Phaeocystis_antarctica.AAC.3